eukprot:TRINITY_DN14145_c0_g1_i1.p1 TRINITY_DN14145_c0_g1~~TRINITY_DN14145_c0_g1_i1.p1  ORF type:complete len:434 (+),score=121.22 TRINITY_DN14145_c0_g1_i1:114-1415(+)
MYRISTFCVFKPTGLPRIAYPASVSARLLHASSPLCRSLDKASFVPRPQMKFESDDGGDGFITAKLAVIGVGGAGGNAVSNMIENNLTGVEFLVANTDAQSLSRSRCTRRIQLGKRVTRGLGAGAKPSVGKHAAEESIDDIIKEIGDVHMLFVAAGMGGGTGTGAAPVIAEAARDLGILTVGIVTTPFHFEGRRRMQMALDGIAALEKAVDTLIVIPNNKLLSLSDKKYTWTGSFKMVDTVLHDGVKSVTDLIVNPGEINLDFADVYTTMKGMGRALMGSAEAEGRGRAKIAASAALHNPLLEELSIQGARGVLINVYGGKDMSLGEVDEIATTVQEAVDPDANIIFGSTFDESLTGKLRVSLIVTGMEHAPRDGRPRDTSRPSRFDEDGNLLPPRADDWATPTRRESTTPDNTATPPPSTIDRVRTVFKNWL